MKTKVIYLILFLIFVLILILYLKSSSPKSDQIQPVKEYIPNTSSTPQKESFKLISTNITEGFMSINGSIQLTFNQPIPNNLAFTIEPKAEVNANLGNNLYEFVITPKDAWAFNTTYTLTIAKSNLSQNDQGLDKTYTYTFNTPPYSGI